MKRATLPPPHRSEDCDAKQLDYEARSVYRRENAKPVWEAFLTWAKDTPTADKRKAVMPANTQLASVTAFFMPYVRMI